MARSLVSAISLVFLLASAESPAPLRPVQTDAAAQELILVSFSGEDAVALIDPRTREVRGKVAVPTNPHEITLTRDRTRAFIATTGGRPGSQRPPNARNVIASLQLGPRRSASTIDLGGCESPHDVRVSADGAIVWVACAPAQTVLEVDARARRQISAWQTGADGGWFVAVTPDGNKIYVPHLEGKRVTVIDRARRKVDLVYESGAQSGIDISPDGKEVWVIDHERSAIRVIDSATDRVVVQAALPSSSFGRLRFTPDGRQVVVVQDKSVSLFDARTRQMTGQIALPFPGKVIDVSPAGDRAAISHPADDRLSIVDLIKGTVIASMPTGRAPDGVAWVR
jgi:DNA-binding beta-propeller fold protein YncE